LAFKLAQLTAIIAEILNNCLIAIVAISQRLFLWFLCSCRRDLRYERRP